MLRDPRISLQDVLDATRSIESFLAGFDEIAFVKNEMVQSAVYYQFAIIGEALNNFSKANPEQATSIRGLRNAIGFRNILTHSYHKVSPELVFQYAQEALPTLLIDVQLLIVKDT
jgi:uncharacterized protein with HEPN domain